MRRTIIAVILGFLLTPSVYGQATKELISGQEPAMQLPQPKLRANETLLGYFDANFKRVAVPVADGFYRVQLPSTASGSLRIQDFYQNGRKQSSPYALTKDSNLDFLLDGGFNEIAIEGPQTLWHANGQKQESQFYRQGQAHGLNQVWDDKGVLQSSGPMVNGQREGTWMEKGQFESDGNEDDVNTGQYHLGLKEGVWTAYSPRWKTRLRMPYFQGLKHGVAQKTDAKGQIDATMPFFADKAEGVASSFRDTDRTVKDERRFVNDLQHGVSLVRVDGLVKREEPFSMGFEHGKSVEYSPKGEVTATIFYKYGQPDGEWSLGDSLIHFKNGQPEGLQVAFNRDHHKLSEKTIVNGVPTGVWRSWSEDGQLRTEETYVNGQREGAWLGEDYGETDLKVQGHFSQGKATGQWIWTNPAQEIVLQGHFVDGAFVSDMAASKVGEQSISEIRQSTLKTLPAGLEGAVPTADGAFSLTHPNKTLALSAHLDQGQYHGGFQRWFANGQMMIKGQFNHNRFDGHWQSWHENGQLAAVGDFVNGLPNGHWQTWDPDGTVNYDGFYDQGKMTGAWLINSSNNVYWQKGHYKDARKDGEWQLIDKASGSIRELTTYVDGARSGLYRDYFDKDQPSVEISYLAKKVSQTLPVPRYDDLVQKDSTLNLSIDPFEFEFASSKRFQDDHAEDEHYRYTSQFDGPFKQWFPGGRLAEQGVYKNALRDGLWQSWYSNGEKQAEMHYDQGAPQGEWLDWYPNHQLRNRMVFQNGQLNGPRTVFYPNGQQWAQWQYSNDEFVGYQEWDVNGRLKTLKK